LTAALKCFTIANSLFRSAKIREYEVVADSQPGHIDQIKQTNAGAVYRLIDQLGPVSRIDLSRLAQLAPASITKIVREMLEAHLVQETEIQEPGSRGRPAVGWWWKPKPGTTSRCASAAARSSLRCAI
jgi:transcriptional regulator of PTS gene